MSKKKMFKSFIAFAVISIIVLQGIPMAFADNVSVLSSSKSWAFSSTDAVSVQGSGTWRQSGKTELADVTAAIVEESTGNYALSIPGNSWVGCFDSFNSGKNTMFKLTADVKLASIAQDAELQLLAWNPGYFMSEGTGASHIKLKNGGVYLYNGVDYAYNALNDGTMNAGTWYTVERYLDFRIEGQNMQKVVIFEQGSSTPILSTDWVFAGTNVNTGSYGNISSVHFSTSGLEDNASTYVDNFGVYVLQNVPTASATGDISDSNKYLTTSLVKYDNGIGFYFRQPNARTYKYFALLEPMKYNRLETKIRLTSTNNTANTSFDIFEFINGAKSVKNPKLDNATTSTYAYAPVRVINNVIYTRSFTNNNGVYVPTDTSTGITFEANKWYRVVVDYEYGYSNSAYTADMGAMSVKIYAEGNDSTPVVNVANIAFPPMTVLKSANYGEYMLALAHTNVDNYNASTFQFDDINVRSWSDKFDGETGNPVFVTDFEAYDVGRTFYTQGVYDSIYIDQIASLYPTDAYAKTSNNATLVDFTITSKGNTIAQDIKYGETYFGKTGVSLKPGKTFINFSFDVAVSDVTKQNFPITTMEGDAFTGYTVTAADIDGTTNTTRTVELNITEELKPDTTYFLDISALEDTQYPFGPVDILTFTTGSVVISDVRFVVNGSVSTTASVVNTNDTVTAQVDFTNTLSEAESLVLILGIYKDGELVDVTTKNVTVNPTNGDIQTVSDMQTIKSTKDGATVKLLAWNNLTDIKPLRTAVIMGVSN